MSKTNVVKFNQLTNAAVGICCIVVTALAVRREFVPTPAVKQAEGKARYVENWEQLLVADATIGPQKAGVKIIEFVDFECPFCADLAVRLKQLQKEYPDELSITLKHFPIRGHKFAHQAAVAYECAKRSKRANHIYDAFFAKQDSIGLRPFRAYARDAGVEDLDGFDECTKRNSEDRISEDLRAAGKLGVNATPTVLVNGWMLPVPPTDDRFREIMEAHRKDQPSKFASGDTLRIKW